jgi:hypothetical protein
MAEREPVVAFTIPWNCKAGPARCEELMPWQRFQRPVMSTMRLRGNDIDGGAVSCTGSQLATVFETIAQTVSLLDCVWHAADADPSPGELAPCGCNAIRLIGGIDRVVYLIRNRPQVDFGFFCRCLLLSIRNAAANTTRQRDHPASGQKIPGSRWWRSTRPSSRSPRILKIFSKICAIGSEEQWSWSSATTPPAFPAAKADAYRRTP